MAGNGESFIEQARSEIGLGLEVIDRETEASLAAAGASPLICGKAQSVVVFDIGGGSTEILWLNIVDGRYRIGDWTSIPAGVVTVAEKFGGKHVSSESFAAMRAHVAELTQPFASRLRNGSGVNPIPDHLLGTSGTVTTVCGIHMNLRRYDRARVDGAWILGDEVGAVTNNLLSMTYEQRASSPCVGPERADLVLAGCAILEEIRNLAGRSYSGRRPRTSRGHFDFTHERGWKLCQAHVDRAARNLALRHLGPQSHQNRATGQDRAWTQAVFHPLA